MSLDPAEWRSDASSDLLDTILALPDRGAAERFFRDLCTLRELHDLAQRWHVVRLLDAGQPYTEISRTTGASTATVTRIAGWLHHGTGGYRERPARQAGPGRRPGEPSAPRHRRATYTTLHDPRAPAPGHPQQGAPSAAHPAAAARRRPALRGWDARAHEPRRGLSRWTSSSCARTTSSSSWPMAWPTWASRARTCSSRAAWTWTCWPSWATATAASRRPCRMPRRPSASRTWPVAASPRATRIRRPHPSPGWASRWTS